MEKLLYHFSSLKDIKFHGVYLNSLAGYTDHYSFSGRPHFHDFYTLVFIRKGEGRIKICNEEITPGENSVMLIAPNQLHSFAAMENSNGSILFFCQDYYIEEFSFIRLLNAYSFVSPGLDKKTGPGYILKGEDATSLFMILDSLQTEYDSGNPRTGSPHIIRSYINILLLRVSELFEIKTGNVNHAESSIIHSLSNFIESSYIKEHKVGYYTSAFNLSEKHLNEICQRNFNYSLKRILQERLMQESRRLLLSTELSVSEIAYRLNFEDNSYFNKVFRKSTGLTPKRFRDMHKKLLP